MFGAVLQFCFVMLGELVSCDFRGNGADVIALVMFVMSSVGCACFGNDGVMCLVGCIALAPTSYPLLTTHGPFTDRLMHACKNGTFLQYLQVPRVVTIGTQLYAK